MKKLISLLLVAGLLFCALAVPASADTLNPDLPLVGDMDGDRQISIFDVTYLQRHLVGIPLAFYVDDLVADADEDGAVTITDATEIQRHLNGVGYRLNIGDIVMPWFDETTSVQADYSFDSGFFEIIRICRSCFYGYSEEYNKVCRFNGYISDEWNRGDGVYCTFDNIWFDSDAYFMMEVDLLSIEHDYFVPKPYEVYKPVIYLYPEEETQVDVKLTLNGELHYTAPQYEDGWQMTAAPDGRLTAQDGRTYPYLFWEGHLNTEYDFSKGFCVKGDESETFLKDSLARLGLNEQETDDFIRFWVPFMKRNPYNVVSFQTFAYTDAAKLDITPRPDTEIRVFMAWYGVEEAVEIPAQELSCVERNGFTAVEWGGQCVK